MATKIAQNLIDAVTAQQIARCDRFEIELPGGKTEVRYAVRSESDDTKEYVVRFIPGKGFTCTCPAGQQGFYNCAHGTCKHCRWAVAHARMYRAEQAAIARNERIAALMGKGLTRNEAVEAVDAKLIVDGKPADIETLARVFRAKNAPTEQEMDAMYQARPFAILR